MRIITLTVQSNGHQGYRLGINTEESRNTFKCRRVLVKLFLPNEKVIECRTSCGNPCNKKSKWITVNPQTGKPFRKKGYDLNNARLSQWIKQNNRIRESNGTPGKLNFRISKTKEAFVLKMCVVC